MRAPGIQELETGPPEALAAQNARRKAEAVRPEVDALVLGVDTIVALDGRIYGKPGDTQQARETLQALSGHRHEVISGLCLIAGGAARTASATTRVEFRVLDEQVIDWYLRSGEWRERAGGYAIQGRGAALVRSVEGDYLNVVGLPLATLLDLAPELLANDL